MNPASDRFENFDGIRKALRAGAVSGLVILSLAACRWDERPPGSPVELAEDVRALVDAFRPFELRLSIDLGHVPCDTGERSTPAPCSPPPVPGTPLSDLLENTLGFPVESSDVEALHTHALAHLLLSAAEESLLDEAIRLLEQTRELGPERAEVAIDLGVAYWERSRRHDRAVDRIRALANFERALEIAPRHAIARFDLALALSQVPIVHEADGLWRGLESQNSPGPWEREARERRARLRKGDLRERFREDLAGLDRSADPETEIRRLVAEFPEASHDYLIEELFPRWAEHYLISAEETPADLRLLEHFCNAFANRAAGLSDRLGSRVLRSILQGPDRQLLATALRHYGRGRDAYKRLVFETAEAELRQASELLRALDSPLLLWSELWRSMIEINGGEHRRAMGRLGALARSPELDPFPGVAGRIRWHQGVSRTRRGLTDRSLEDFRTALSIFEALDFDESVGFLHFMIADDLDLLGDEEGAWRHRLSAFEVLAERPLSVAAHNTLTMSATALLDPVSFDPESFDPESFAPASRPLARRLIDEALTLAVWRGRPSSTAEVLLTSARWHRRSGDLSAAGHDLDLALQAGRELDPSNFRDRVENLLVLEEAELAAHTKASEALATLDALNRRFRHREFHLGVLETHGLRAEILRRRGDFDAAQVELGAAVQVVVGQNRNLSSTERRLGHLHGTQSLFDELIGLQLESETDPQNALGTTECARLAVFGERFAKRLGIDATTPCRDLGPVLRRSAANLAPHQAILAHAMLPERLLTWRITSGGLEVFYLDVAAETLQERIDALVEAIRDDDRPRLHALGDSLRRELVAKPLSGLAGITDLTLVPDRATGRIPFAALVDATTERFLVEDYTIRLAATALGEPRASPPSANPSSKSFLLVANPTLDSTLYPGLDPLPGAEAEVARIEGHHPPQAVHTLRRTEATRDEILELLPQIRVFHFAGHAVADPDDPFRSYLALAKGHQPDFGDPSLEARQLLDGSIDLTALDLAILSACDTAAGSTERGGGLTGLAMAFLLAGSQQVLGTLWSIEDGSPVDLMDRFHAHLARGVAAESALREAQLESLRSSEPELARPRTWGSFTWIVAGAR